MSELNELTAGMPIVYGGNRVATVSEDLASAFAPGDHLVVVQTTGDLIHIPSADWEVAQGAVGRASAAFGQMGSVSDAAISEFYRAFARLLAGAGSFRPIAEANAADIEAARARGRSTTRLELTDKMRSDMISGLEGWADQPSGRGQVVDSQQHDGLDVHQCTL